MSDKEQVAAKDEPAFWISPRASAVVLGVLALVLLARIIMTLLQGTAERSVVGYAIGVLAAAWTAVNRWRGDDHDLNDSRTSVTKLSKDIGNTSRQ